MDALLHFLIGPVGAGKSTYAKRRCAREPALLLDVDTWMVRLFGGDARPSQDVLAWYLERRERVRGLVWDTALAAIAAGAVTYLELGLVTARERAHWFERAQACGLGATITLLDAPREVRRARVAQRNLEESPDVQKVPAAFFEAASDAWEDVTTTERARWRIGDA